MMTLIWQEHKINFRVVGLVVCAVAATVMLAAVRSGLHTSNSTAPTMAAEARGLKAPSCVEELVKQSRDMPVHATVRGVPFTEHLSDPDIDNLRVKEIQAVMSPQLLMDEIPITQAAYETVLKGRQDVSNVIQGKDDRLLVVVGPCSIHDPEAALEYAAKLKTEKDRLAKDLLIVMRVYFEKPRTTVGWKGLINDPGLDGSFSINTGLRIGRKLLQKLNGLGVPAAVEFLDTNSPQYLSDLVSWGAIGARTTESQLHRELASALSMPIGFKSSTFGDVNVAVDSCLAATHEHCFFGNTKQGLVGIVHSKGNPDVHTILRGGKNGPNYDAPNVQSALATVAKHPSLPQGLVIDCSHANSEKDHNRQPIVAQDVGEQLKQGQTGIRGVMLESHLFGGNQKLPEVAEPDFGHRNKALLTGEGDMRRDDIGDEIRKQLKYGVSVTDACIDWETTVKTLNQLAADTRARREVVKQKASQPVSV